MAVNRDGISFENFLGGINEAVDNNLLETTECSLAQNVNIDNGNLKTSTLGTIFGGDAGGVIQSIMPYYKNSQGTLLVALHGDIKMMDNNNSYVTVHRGMYSNNYDYVNYNVDGEDVIILTNGVDIPLICNGSSFRLMKNRRKAYNDDGSFKGYYDANEQFKSNLDEVQTYAPKCKYIELHYERIWLCGDSENPSKLYYSTADVNGFDPEDFTSPTTEEEVNQHGGEIDVWTNDGGKIIGLKVIFDDIVIFKDKNIFKIFGNNPNNYTKIQIFSSNGAIADKSIVNTHVGAFFINKDAIYIYDGTNVKPISQKINKTFKNLNNNYLNNAVAIFFNNKYILAVPEGNSTENNLIIEYDLDRKNFVFKRGIVVSSFCEFNGNLYYSSNDSYLRNYYGGPTGQAIYETGSYDFGYINARKDAERFYFIGSGNGNIRVKCITDKKTTEKIITLTPDEKMYKLKLKNKGRVLKYRIENINNSSFSIKSCKAIVEVDVD